MNVCLQAHGSYRPLPTTLIHSVNIYCAHWVFWPVLGIAADSGDVLDTHLLTPCSQQGLLGQMPREDAWRLSSL